MSCLAAYVAQIPQNPQATTDATGASSTTTASSGAATTSATDSTDTFETGTQNGAATGTAPEVLPSINGGDLTDVVTGAGGASLEELQAAASAILKHIVPSLLGDGEATARTMLDALANVLATSRSVPDSQQIRDALADWIHHLSDLIGTPVLDALRAESANAAGSATTTTTASAASTGTTATSAPGQSMTPAQIAAAFLTRQLAGGGDNWINRVPANIQAQINANGGCFTGYATLLTQVPNDLDSNDTSGIAPWWTGAHVAATSAQMVGYRDENGELVFPDPNIDPMTGLPKGILAQANVFFQPTVGYSEGSGYSLGMIGNVGIVDTSLKGWEQAPTLCLDEVREVLISGLKAMGLPDELIGPALEQCYKYDPAFGVLIPEGVGAAAQQLYQSRHGRWYDAVFEAIPAIIIAVVAPELIGLVAPALVGAAAAALGVTETVAQGILAAGVTSGAQAAMNGGNFFSGFLTGLCAAYGGSLAGNWASLFGSAGSQAVTAMAGSAIRQLFSTGQLDLRQIIAAGVGAGLTIELDQATGLPKWATGAIGQGTANYLVTGNVGSAAAAAVTGAATAAITSGAGSASGVGQASGTARDGVLELQVTFNGETVGLGSGTLAQLPDGSYVITTANHLFTDDEGKLMFVDPNTGQQSYLGEGGFGLSVMVNGVAIQIPVDSIVSDAVVDADGHYRTGTQRSNVANDAMAIRLSSAWVADNIPGLALQLPAITMDPLVVGGSVHFSGFVGEVDENGDRPFASVQGTILSVDPQRGITAMWMIDDEHSAIAGGMSGGKIYNDKGELVGILNGEVRHVGNMVIAIFTPVRLDPDGNLILGNGQNNLDGGRSSGGSEQGA